MRRRRWVFGGACHLFFVPRPFHLVYYHNFFVLDYDTCAYITLFDYYCLVVASSIHHELTDVYS